MQRIFLYMLFCFTVLQTRAQQQIVQKIFGLQTQNVSEHIIQMNNGDFIFNNTGFNPSTLTELSSDLIRVDSSFNLIWSKRYFFSNNRIRIAFFEEVSSDTIIAVGGIYNTTNSYAGLALLMIDGNGNCITAKIINNLGAFYISGIERSTDQQMFVLYGKYVATSFYDERMHIMAYDKNLNFLWGKHYTYGYHDNITSAKFYLNNGLLIMANSAGNVDSSSTEPCCNVLLIRLTNTGNSIWVKRIGNMPNLHPGGDDVFAGSVLVLQNGNIINAVETNYFAGFPYTDIIIQKTDTSGNEINAVQIGNYATQFEYFSQIFMNINSHIFIRYRFTSNMILDDNLNFIAYKRIIPNTGSFGASRQIPLRTGATAVLGSRTDIDKTEIIQTDSIANIGCYQLPTITFPYQQVSFPNSIPMKTLQDSSITIQDSSITINTISVSYSDSLLCMTSTATTEYSNNDSLTIYPTVFTNGINIRNNIENTLLVELLDTSGKLLLSKNLTSNYINLSSVSKGLYFLKIISKSHIKTFKIIKQ
ncbi:MAG: hypothetical protein BWX95_00164 [Bacteroidetes bacterium ADurb.Bin141]|nr:MAG: hypothetical protein BWX95_00164 [Bacteroidetes bacterium ADurb.Bin141]